ncbi:MAG: hypothetical protein FJW27_18470, partial [Acidimicrobiia bacterium]|nr:hypothetical protein [Acidimicrobiia bacterium]
VRSELDRRRYPDGVTVSDAQMATVQLKRHEFHGDWNYTIAPPLHTAAVANLISYYLTVPKGEAVWCDQAGRQHAQVQ